MNAQENGEEEEEEDPCMKILLKGDEELGK
jgi:hypothetical protein